MKLVVGELRSRVLDLDWCSFTALDGNMWGSATPGVRREDS
jgi:hypothetical protein